MQQSNSTRFVLCLCTILLTLTTTTSPILPVNALLGLDLGGILTGLGCTVSNLLSILVPVSNDATPEMILGGIATRDSNGIHLQPKYTTPTASTAFYKRPIAFMSGTQITFDVKMPSNSPGFAFVIVASGDYQNAPKLVQISGTDGSLGYEYPNSIAIEFDAQRQGPTDSSVSGSHIEVHTAYSGVNSWQSSSSVSTRASQSLADSSSRSFKILFSDTDDGVQASVTGVWLLGPKYTFTLDKSQAEAAFNATQGLAAGWIGFTTASTSEYQGDVTISNIQISEVPMKNSNTQASGSTSLVYADRSPAQLLVRTFNQCNYPMATSSGNVVSLTLTSSGKPVPGFTTKITDNYDGTYIAEYFLRSLTSTQPVSYDLSMTVAGFSLGTVTVKFAPGLPNATLSALTTGTVPTTMFQNQDISFTLSLKDQFGNSAAWTQPGSNIVTSVMYGFLEDNSLQTASSPTAITDSLVSFTYSPTVQRLIPGTFVVQLKDTKNSVQTLLSKAVKVISGDIDPFETKPTPPAGLIHVGVAVSNSVQYFNSIKTLVSTLTSTLFSSDLGIKLVQSSFSHPIYHPNAGATPMTASLDFFSSSSATYSFLSNISGTYNLFFIVRGIDGVNLTLNILPGAPVSAKPAATSNLSLSTNTVLPAMDIFVLDALGNAVTQPNPGQHSIQLMDPLGATNIVQCLTTGSPASLAALTGSATYQLACVWDATRAAYQVTFVTLTQGVWSLTAQTLNSLVPTVTRLINVLIPSVDMTKTVIPSIGSAPLQTGVNITFGFSLYSSLNAIRSFIDDSPSLTCGLTPAASLNGLFAAQGQVVTTTTAGYYQCIVSPKTVGAFVPRVIFDKIGGYSDLTQTLNTIQSFCPICTQVKPLAGTGYVAGTIVPIKLTTYDLVNVQMAVGGATIAFSYDDGQQARRRRLLSKQQLSVNVTDKNDGTYSASLLIPATIYPSKTIQITVTVNGIALPVINLPVLALEITAVTIKPLQNDPVYPGNNTQLLLKGLAEGDIPVPHGGSVITFPTQSDYDASYLDNGDGTYTLLVRVASDFVGASLVLKPLVDGISLLAYTITLGIGSTSSTGASSSSSSSTGAPIQSDPCWESRQACPDSTTECVSVLSPTTGLYDFTCRPLLQIVAISPKSAYSNDTTEIRITLLNAVPSAFALSVNGYTLAWTIVNFDSVIFNLPPASTLGLIVPRLTEPSGGAGLLLNFTLSNGTEQYTTSAPGLSVFATPCAHQGTYFVVDTGDCFSCPEHAYCPGGPWIYPLPGYYGNDAMDPNPKKCLLNEACNGYDPDYAANAGYTFIPATQCNAEAGYQGVICSECDDAHFSDQNKCRACDLDITPQNRLVLTIFAALIIFTIMAAGVAFISDERLVIFITIIVFIQQCSFVGSVGASRFQSPGLSEFFQFLALFNFEVSYFKLGCTVPQITFVKVFWATIAMMITAAILLTLASGIFALTRSRNFLIEKDATRLRIWSRRFQNSMVVLGVVVYLQLTSQFIKGVFCVEVNGLHVLQVEPSTVCYTGSHLWTAIFFIWPMLFAYSIGFPLFCLFIVLRTRRLNLWASSAAKFIYLYRGLRIRFIYFKHFNFLTSFALALQLTLSTTQNTSIRLATAFLFFSLNVWMVGVYWPFYKKYENILSIAAGLANSFSGLAILTVLSNQVGRDSSTLGPLSGGLLFAVGISVLMFLIIMISPARWVVKHYMPTKEMSEDDDLLQEGKYDDLADSRTNRGLGYNPSKLKRSSTRSNISRSNLDAEKASVFGDSPVYSVEPSTTNGGHNRNDTLTGQQRATPSLPTPSHQNGPASPSHYTEAVASPSHYNEAVASPSNYNESADSVEVEMQQMPEEIRRST